MKNKNIAIWSFILQETSKQVTAPGTFPLELEKQVRQWCQSLNQHSLDHSQKAEKSVKNEIKNMSDRLLMFDVTVKRKSQTCLQITVNGIEYCQLKKTS